MNSTKLKRKVLQKSKTLPLRNESKLKKYNRRSLANSKDHVPAKVINEFIHIKRKRIKYIEGYNKPSAFGDNDSVKSTHSQESVIYVGTKFLDLPDKAPSIVDLTKSDSDVSLSSRKRLKNDRSRVVTSITTIQSVRNLACTSSEDFGLMVKSFNRETAQSTKSSIQLKRTNPCTSMPEPEKSLVPVDDANIPFLDDVSTLISRDLRQINTMVYEMDIDTIVELYKVDTLDPFDGLDI